MFSIWKNKEYNFIKHLHSFYKNSGIYLMSIIMLFLLIGLLTTIKPAYRFSSDVITEWTSDIDSSTFLFLLGMENRTFKQAYPNEKEVPRLSKLLFQITTSIRPSDPRSLLEIPGFSSFGNQIIIAGEGTTYMNLSIESSPPLEDVLEEREAIIEESQEGNDEQESKPDQLTTGDKKVVFIYNTHNRESFLPHLPDINDPNLAHHGEVNVTKVSQYFAKMLESKGIGSEVDYTDHMSVLNEKGWGYGQSYKASRSVVTEAL